MGNKNKGLTKAKKDKKDEFYTQLSDIERELKNYKSHFQGKIIYCNCDDPRVSNFFHYFSYNFEHLGLKKLIATCYKTQQIDLFSRNDCEKAVYLEYFGDKNNNKIPDQKMIDKIAKSLNIPSNDVEKWFNWIEKCYQYIMAKNELYKVMKKQNERTIEFTYKCENFIIKKPIIVN